MKGIDKGEAASIAIILAGFAVLMFIYYSQGPSWDVVAQYMYGKGVLSHQFLSKNFTISGDTIYTNGTYIELFRYPLSGLLLGVLSIILSPQFAFYFYIALLYLFFVYSLDKLGRTLGISGLILFAVFLNPYTITFMFINNGSEALTTSIVLLAIAAILEKDERRSGLLLGVAALARYTSTIFLPMLLLLKKKEKIFNSVLFYAAPIAIWLGVNYYFFGNPFFSYYKAVIDEIAANPITQFYPQALEALLGIPAILFAFYVIADKHIRGGKISKTFKHARTISYVFFLLSVVGFLLIEPRLDAFQQARLGYSVAVSLLLLVSLFIGEITNTYNKNTNKILTALGVLSVLLLAWVSYYYYTTIATKTTTYQFDILNPQSVFSSAKSELLLLGLGNCRVISNQWVVMRYFGVPAYSVYSINSTTLTYPIVAFSYSSPLPPSLTANVTKIAFSNGYFSVYLPRGWNCVRQ